jgi:hypothetical protein
MSAIRQNKQRYREELAKLTDEEQFLLPAMIVTHVSNKLTEPLIPQLLQNLIDRGATLYGITLADTSVIPDVGAFPTWRSQELKRLEIHFSTGPERIEFLEFSPRRGTHPLFSDGILYCNSIHKKGVVLNVFIDRVQHKPTSLICVDDTLANLQNIDEEMKKIGIPFLGLHYSPNMEPTHTSDKDWDAICQGIHWRFKQAVIPSGIIQTRSASAIEWAIDSSTPESLIIFDVGHVLLSPCEAILYSKYRPWVKGWLEQRGIRELDKTTLFAIERGAKWEVVDPKIVDLIDQGKAKSKMIALSRYWSGKPFPDQPSFEELRLLSLTEVGIDFGEPFPQATGWSHEELRATYGRGLIHTEAKLKGPVLQAFLKHLHWQPKSIVFVDDRIEQCESIAAVGRELNIPVLCIHFTRNADQAPPLDLLLADLKLSTLIDEGVWLTDEAASQLLNSSQATVHPERLYTPADH